MRALSILLLSSLLGTSSLNASVSEPSPIGLISAETGYCLPIVEYQMSDDVADGTDLYDYHWQVREIVPVYDLRHEEKPVRYFKVSVGHISSEQEKLISPHQETQVILPSGQILSLQGFDDYLALEWKR